mgnify:CR=1 FL=1|tara:strand:- start:213 stop:464 length:252 start_codon:yes stop_codon:yes gene_type:complete
MGLAMFDDAYFRPRVLVRFSIMKIELSQLITILSVAAVLGGFYYGTQLRLDHLEEQVTSCSADVKTLEKKVNNVQRQLKKAKR